MCGETGAAEEDPERSAPYDRDAAAEELSRLKGQAQCLNDLFGLPKSTSGTAILRWCDAGGGAKSAGEGAVIAEAAGVGDVGDGLGGVS